MNIEKHVKTPAEQLAEAENSLVPTHARGKHLVDPYIKGCRADYQTSRSASTPEAPQFVLRFDGLPTTPTSLARVRRRVEEINRQLRLSEAPFRLRVM
jgi:hypothetical protein